MSDVQVDAMIEAKMKKMRLVEVVNQDGTVTFTALFGNGAVHEFVLDPTNGLYAAFAIHGARQKLSDAGSTKKTADDAEKAVASLIEALEAGEWSMRGAGGESAPTGGLLAKALSNLYQKDLTEVQNYLNGLHADDKERAKIHNALRAQADVAAEIERIRPAKKERKVNETAAQAAAAALAGLAG